MALTWPYIAGFFDGEGSIRLTMGNGAQNIHIGIHQSQKRGLILLTEIQHFILNYGITSGINKHGNQPTTGHPIYRLYIYNIPSALKFISYVFPYIHIKKLECQDVRRFAYLYPPFYAWLKRQMKAVMCEVCGQPRTGSHRSRTCGAPTCRGTLIWRVRHKQAPQGSYLLQKAKILDRL